MQTSQKEKLETDQKKAYNEIWKKLDKEMKTKQAYSFKLSSLTIAHTQYVWSQWENGWSNLNKHVDATEAM